jgi:hypothetical protein
MRSPAQLPYGDDIVGRNTERNWQMATTTDDLDLMNRMIATPPHDNSALRARLGGRVIEQHSIEAELRALMADRADGLVVDVREGGSR